MRAQLERKHMSERGNPSLPEPHDAPAPCACIIGRTLTAAQLGELARALRGEGPQAGSLGKIALTYKLPKSTVAAHKSKCLGGCGTPAPAALEPDTIADAAGVAPHRDARIAYLTRRLDRGRDEGFATYSTLARTWGVPYPDVLALACEARAVWRASQGDTSGQANRSIAMLARVQREAWRVVRTNKGDPKAQTQALGVIQKAQSSIDRATGVAGTPMGNVVQTPEFQLLISEIRAALASIPGALDAVTMHMADALAKRRAGNYFSEMVSAFGGDITTAGRFATPPTTPPH